MLLMLSRKPPGESRFFFSNFPLTEPRRKKSFLVVVGRASACSFTKNRRSFSIRSFDHALPPQISWASAPASSIAAVFQRSEKPPPIGNRTKNWR